MNEFSLAFKKTKRVRLIYREYSLELKKTINEKIKQNRRTVEIHREIITSNTLSGRTNL